MKKRRKIIFGASIILLSAVLLLPFKIRLKDGGSTEYKPLVPVYSVTRYHRINNDPAKEFEEGYKIALFGFVLWDDLQEI